MGSHFSKLYRRQHGFSLLEVVVALGLVSVALIALLSTLSTSGHIGLRTEEDHTAVALARSQVEFIKQQSYVEPPAYATLSPPVGFEIKVSGEILVPLRLQRITVEVTHSGRVYTLDAYKANRVPGARLDPGSSPPGGAWTLGM
jgi:prepilin-type N-terminal cleavage/methylation domain-containing protein